MGCDRHFRPRTAGKKSKQRSTNQAQIVDFDGDTFEVDGCDRVVAVSPAVNKKGLVVTPGGRPSVKKNAVNTKYAPGYRNALNTREIMGRKLTIGKACALFGIVHFGPNLPLEEAGHDGRLRVFKDAAYYALSDDELEDILDTEQAALVLYLLGIFRAQARVIKFIAPASIRDEFEQSVFRPASKDPVIQSHLGLSMTESIFDQ